MVSLDMDASLESFRKFVMASTCESYAPRSYLDDFEVFAERESGLGAIHVEAAEKIMIKKIREITFVNARDVLGVMYASKSGNTSLRWRQTEFNRGRVTGEASTNSLVNLAQAGVITLEWVEKYAKESAGP